MLILNAIPVVAMAHGGFSDPASRVDAWVLASAALSPFGLIFAIVATVVGSIMFGQKTDEVVKPSVLGGIASFVGSGIVFLIGTGLLAVFGTP